METKQVIIIRKDLKMRKGKMIAQATHSTKMTILQYATFDDKGFRVDYSAYGKNAEAVKNWLSNLFTTVVVSVDSEQEFLDIKQKAIENGMITSSVLDSGKTEFNGVPTLTALSIGPASVDEFSGITSHLNLL